jgi:hypothetical protein
MAVVMLAWVLGARLLINICTQDIQDKISIPFAHQALDEVSNVCHILIAPRRAESYDRERIQTLLPFLLTKAAGNHSCGQHTCLPSLVLDVNVSFHSSFSQGLCHERKL